MCKFSDGPRKKHIAYEMLGAPGEHPWSYPGVRHPGDSALAGAPHAEIAGVDLR